MTHAILVSADGSKVPFQLELTPHAVTAANLPDGYEFLDVFLEDFQAEQGDDGYFLLPTVPCRNRPSAIVRFTPREDCQDIYRINDMPVFGVNHGSTATLAVVSGMSIDFNLVCGVRDGHYDLHARFPLHGKHPYETPAIKLFPLTGEDADYCGMARRYRSYQLERGACTPLIERIEQFPVLREEARALEIRIRHAWKPVPPPVLEQTPENEPDLTVAVTFQRAGEIMDKCYQKGVRHAEFCLVGWNKSGHDGRFPDLFPVEPKLGGETELRKLIARAKSYGYLITCHTNLKDAYSISQRLNPDDIAQDENGNPVKGGQWGGGQAYLLCPKAAYEHYLKDDMKALKKLGFQGQHYFDVLSIVEPKACHHPNHPLNPREAAEWNCKILQLARENIGATASEGNLDFCVHDLDFVLYALFDIEPKCSPLIDEFVPFWFIAYHGILLYNVCAKTVNAMVKSDPNLHLKNIELGGRPTAYFHAQFLTNGNPWMGKEDMRCQTDDELERATDALAKTEREFQTLADLQYDFIHSHQNRPDNTSVTTYESGTKIIVNFNDSPAHYQNYVIPPHDYLRLSDD